MQALKKALPIALALTTAVMGTTAHAKSIGGSVDFRVTLPEVLVLYHWDDAHLELRDVATTSDNDSDAGREISTTGTQLKQDEVGKTAYEVTGNLNTTDNSKVRHDSVTVTLKNAWGVRALSSGNVKLKIEEKNPKLLSVKAGAGVTDSFILVKDTKIVKGSASAVKDADLSLPSGWELSMGDIQFNLDLSNAKHVGQYNTRGSNDNNGVATTAQEDKDVFLLTLTGETPSVLP